MYVAFTRAQVATQLKDLVQYQHRQLAQTRWGSQVLPGGHPPLSGTEGPYPGSHQGNEMSELRALVHSLRCEAYRLAAAFLNCSDYCDE